MEDDDSIRELLAAGLRFAGHEVVAAASGGDGLEAIATSGPDLVVLDVNLPDVDGFEMCRRLRAAGDDVPVIYLTARRRPEDLREGFAGGGDDYVTKPFGLDELALRIDAVLRRTGPRASARPGASARLSCGHVELDPDAHRVWRDGQEIETTPTEYRLLEHLMRNVDLVLTRMQILDAVWGEEFDGDWQIIETYVSSLRRKLDLADRPSIIRTVRGVGYGAQRPPVRRTK